MIRSALCLEKAAKNVILDAPYEKTFRPDGSPGCGALEQRIRFPRP